MSTKSPTIGIIGGRGKTGAQFTRLFRNEGFTVRVTGARERGKNRVLLDECDVIIFSVPLSRAAEIMEEELRHATRKDQLILDVSSLKMRETAAMARANGEVIGLHPLFGPTTEPKGERIILTPVRASKKTRLWLIDLLRRMGMAVTIMTPSEHDTLMGTIQVIPHLKSLLMADVLRARKTNLREALRNCTPTYEMEFNVIGRFLDDHPDLYMPIIFRNPETVQILRSLQEIIGEYLRIAETGDLPSAEQRYRACQKQFQLHLKRARRESEACIRTLLSLA